MGLAWAGRDRAGQNKAGWDRTGQGVMGKDRAGPRRIGQGVSRREKGVQGRYRKKIEWGGAEPCRIGQEQTGAYRNGVDAARRRGALRGRKATGQDGAGRGAIGRQRRGPDRVD